MGYSNQQLNHFLDTLKWCRAFPNPKIEEEFQEFFYQEKFRRTLRYMWIGIIAFLMFSGMDYIGQPDHYVYPISARVATTILVAMILWFVQMKAPTRKWAYGTLILGIAAIAACVTFVDIIGTIYQNWHDPKGILIVFMFTSAITGLPFRTSSSLLGLLLLAYITGILYFTQHGLGYLIGQAVLFAVITAMGGTASFAKENEARKEFLTRLIIENSRNLIEAQSRDIRSIMTNINQGLCLIEGEDLHFGTEYSNYMKGIVGDQMTEETSFVDTIFQTKYISSHDRDALTIAMKSSIGEPEFQFEVNSHLLPREIQRSQNDKTHIFETDWSPIINSSGKVEKILFTMRDVTEFRALQAESNRHADDLIKISRILSIPQGAFDRFIETCERYLKENLNLARIDGDIPPGAFKTMFRNMHTLKGNASSMGFSDIADAAHLAEEKYSKFEQETFVDGKNKLIIDLEYIQSLVDSYKRVNFDKLGRSKDDGQIIHIDRDIVRRNISSLAAVDLESLSHVDRRKVENIKALFNQLVFNQIDKVLEEQFHSLGRIAKEQGKEKPTIAIDDPGISFSADGHELVTKIFTHLLRNSMDHGIETPETRAAKGKPHAGILSFQLSVVSGGLRIEYYDDGSGLNLDSISKIGREKGLIGEADQLSPRGIANLIFAPGFSTKKEVSEISGRGVGMDAVRTFIEDAGGTIDLVLEDKAYAATDPLGYWQTKFILILPEKIFDMIADQSA